MAQVVKSFAFKPESTELDSDRGRVDQLVRPVRSKCSFAVCLLHHVKPPVPDFVVRSSTTAASGPRERLKVGRSQSKVSRLRKGMTVSAVRKLKPDIPTIYDILHWFKRREYRGVFHNRDFLKLKRPITRTQ
ncbi:hypothetical protein EVAR_65959_1 [Eumeta japonica]|uniref:Uncharacterized protein n=1 Tax=Eumeta variegata TaxID=151549 RepID=A0A4C1ZAY0_EUMVA|nr:hypothetical protein EVAR_65959_1 [Eumeta japonica]